MVYVWLFKFFSFFFLSYNASFSLSMSLWQKWFPQIHIMPPCSKALKRILPHCRSPCSIFSVCCYTCQKIKSFPSKAHSSSAGQCWSCREGSSDCAVKASLLSPSWFSNPWASLFLKGVTVAWIFSWPKRYTLHKVFSSYLSGWPLPPPTPPCARAP